MPITDYMLEYNNFSLGDENSENIASERYENRHLRRPLSCLTPHISRTPANICITLILPTPPLFEAPAQGDPIRISQFCVLNLRAFTTNKKLNPFLFLRATAYAIVRICHGNSVCPSVRLSVRHTGGSVKNG